MNLRVICIEVKFVSIQLDLDNVYLKITGMEKEDEVKLWNILCFQIQIYGMQEVRYRHLYNRKTKKTYAGLLDYVIEFLENNDLEYVLNDNRVKPESNADFKLVEFIDDEKTIPLKLRPYQQEIVDNCREREVIQAATGAGKTLMMAATIAKFNVKPVCIFADKIGLCMQLKQEIEKFLGVEVGIVGDGLKEYKDITVISLQSAEQEYVEKAKMILFDECHHVPAATCTEVANQCTQAYYRVGVSATPWRDAGDEMLIEACLAKRHNETNINASKLIELGYLVKPDICFVPIKQVFKGKNYNDIYNQAIVNNDYRNRIIYKITEQMYIRNKHILILFKTIKHGEEMQKQLLDRLGEEVTPIRVINPKNCKETTVRVRNVEMLSGNDDALRRTAVFEAVKQGICRCLIASTIADEGLDLPILDTLILAGGGKSSTRAFQRVGRVLRLAEGKEKAIVFDFIDYTPMLRRHSRTRQKYYETEPLWDIRKFVVNPDT